MTIREAIRQGVSRVRLPEWNPSAYIALPDTGPWATLHDEIATPGQIAPLLLTELLKDARTDYEDAA